MQRAIGILFCLLALAPLSAHAQKVYMCKDASGKTHTSDRPIPECADRAIREFDRNGLRREIAAPPTAEEKRQKQLEDEKRKAEKAAAEEKKQSDQAILGRYRNEGDIEVARKRALDLVQEQVKRETTVLATAEKRRKEAQAELDIQKKKNAVSPDLPRKIEEADQSVKEVKKRMQDYEAEIAQINAKHDETLKRYRELTGSAATK